MKPKIIIDTNVLLVSVSKKSKFRWIFDSFINEKYILSVTTDILLEYEEIISKHMTKQIADVVLQIIQNASNTEFITRYYKWNLIKNDPDDNKFADCAIVANADYLLTHDKHFNILKNIDFPKINVINIDEFRNIIENNNN